MVSGVGDYAFLLARELREAHGIDTIFLLTDPQSATGETIEGFPVEILGRRNSSGLRAALRGHAPKPVLLHYVGYAYSPKGCPFWLIRGLERWRSRDDGARSAHHALLLTMFHELYATGALWTSAGLTSPLQRWLTARLACLADQCLTNRCESACELLMMRRGRGPGVLVYPVFSNFGEPAQPTPLARRQPQAVWFGGRGRSARDSTLTLRRLRAALENLHISKLTTIGARELDLDCPGIAVERCSTVSRADASELLSRSRVGVLDYFDGYLGKSGIFAAYSSHGLLPLLLAPNNSEADGLASGRDYLVASQLTSSLSMSAGQQIADYAVAWYDSHNLARTAAAFAASLRAVGAKKPRQKHSIPEAVSSINNSLS